MPGAGLLGGVAWEIADIFGAHSNVGAVVIVRYSRHSPRSGCGRSPSAITVTAADLDRTNVTPVEEAERAGVPAAVAVTLRHRA